MQKSKTLEKRHWNEGQNIGNCAKIKIWSNEQAQLGIRPGEWEAQTSLRFWDTNGSLKLGQTTRPSDSQQKGEPVRPADHRGKIKESEKRDNYLDLVEN